MSEIGSGAFGQVYLGYHKLIRCKVCLKKGNRNISQNAIENSANNDNLMREFYYLREFKQHPHITKLYEIIFTETSVYMILEYYPSGDLFEYVTTNGHLSVNEALRIFTQLVGAVYYLHKSGCCHRDLKLENVLLDKQMNVKLSDFGFTRELPFAQHGSKSLLSEYCGTGAYMAPEIVRRTPYSGIKIDIWALGIMFYTMLTGEMPFDDSLDSKSLEYAIIHNKPKYLENLETLDPEETAKLQQIKMLLNGMLSKDPENRISSLEDVLRLPLFELYGGEYEITLVNKLHFGDTGAKTSWSDLTTSEKAIFKRLVNAGIDKEILERSIRKETLDSVYGFWALLKDESDKKAKKSKKSKRKSRSMLKLTSSRSFIGNARQAFSSSPMQELENQIPLNEVHIPRVISSHGSVTTAGASSMEIPIMRSGSLKKVRDLVLKPETPKKLNSIHETFTKPEKELKPENHNIANLKKQDTSPQKKSLDQGSILSKSTQVSNVSSKKKKKPFSIFKLFKSKNSSEEKPVNKIPDTESLYRNVTTNTSASFQNISHTENISPRTNIKKSISFSENKANKPALEYTNASEENILLTPDNSKLKRSRPTRPVSEFSTYSTHTSVSETSNGSGYITGYSTDINALGSMNNGNTLNVNTNHHDSQQIHSPQISSRQKFSRGVSEWSANISSQAESPNSSFVALSRSNSIDSLSRSFSNRKKGNTTNKNMTFMRRGRSPLNSKINAKWASINMEKKKKSFVKQDKSQIIEEETSGDEEEEAQEARDLEEKKLRSPTLRPSRSYMRKGSMKFPVLPVTEEDDDSIDAEDEADLESHDYDDLATENSEHHLNKPAQLRSTSNFSSTLFQDNSAIGEGIARTSSIVSENSMFIADNDKTASLLASVCSGSESLLGSVLSQSASTGLPVIGSASGSMKRDKTSENSNIDRNNSMNSSPFSHAPVLNTSTSQRLYSPVPRNTSPIQRKAISQLEKSFG